MLEVARGLTRLRNASILRAVSAALALAISPLVSAWLPHDAGAPAPADLGQPATLTLAFTLLILLFLGLLILFLVMVASWILRVLGWGNICRTKLRTFYCVTRIIVLAAPIIGFLVIIAGFVDAIIRILASGGFVEQPVETILEIIPTFSLYMLAGHLITSAADFFEAVATLDLSLLYHVGLLKAASIIYLFSLCVRVIAQVASLSDWWSLSPSLAAFTLLTLGYHALMKSVRQQILQPSPVPTQGG